MYVLSTGRKTLLSDFPDLETKSTYTHANGESTDFQFNAQKRIFVEINRKSGLEVMRIKELQNQSLQIQRVRKLTIDNVYCIGCAKQTVQNIAVGLSSGHVKLYNYKTAQLLHRFQSDDTRNTVLFLDYNCTDEYLSSVLETGDVNIYGIKTKTKIETLNIDGQSTLARFHPTKRFQLAVASYKGSVTVYDVQAKRKLFNNLEAHDAPCRDLCMCISTPHTLVSVGYDCKINIFDMRHRAQLPCSKLSHLHPLSTVALSDCGTYFCVGNLKGDIISYDIRNTKENLATRKVHDCAVARIGFVPNPEDGGCSFSNSGNFTIETPAPVQATANATTDLSKSIANNLLSAQQTEQVLNTPAALRGHRDSFCDFLDFQSNKMPRLIMRRDSFDWEALSRKPSSDEHRNSLHQVSSNVNSMDSVNSSTTSLKASEILDNKLSVPLQPTNSGPLRERNNNLSLPQPPANKLNQIQEEEHQNSLAQKLHSVSSSSASDKENTRNDEECIIVDTLKLEKHQSVSQPLANTNGIDVLKELSELRKLMDERFSHLEIELKCMIEANKIQMLTNNASFLNQQASLIEQVRDGLIVLLRKDKFMNELMRLQMENDVLKIQLKRLEKEKKDLQRD